jgi:putative aminopeptidase FrvX
MDRRADSNNKKSRGLQPVAAPFLEYISCTVPHGLFAVQEFSMHDDSFAFLKRLLETPSPSGHERGIQQVVRDWAGEFADEIRTDRHGNVIALRRPPKASRQANAPRIMLAGHCDQIGLMVQHIDSDGFLYVQPIGGWDMQILLGQYLTICSRAGPVTGVISRKAPHLMTNEERVKVPQFNDVWVDIGVKNREEAEKLVRCGDPATIALGVRELRDGLVASPGLDDKVGLWVVMETLRLLHGKPVPVEVYSVSTVQEEVGLRGAVTSAYGIHPTVGIAVDVCHATDTPGNEKKQLGETKLGAGPVLFRGPNINPRVLERLEESAAALEVAVQIRGAPRPTGTDANVMQLARDGVATAVVGIPNRYMHSPVEMVHLDDLDRAARLLAEFCMRASPEHDWTP